VRKKSLHKFNVKKDEKAKNLSVQKRKLKKKTFVERRPEL